MGRSIKSKEFGGTIADISDAINGLVELGNEIREVVDNATEAGKATNRIQTLEATADVLENFSEPDVPECLNSTSIKWNEFQPRSKRAGLSRSNRCANFVAVLQSAKDAAEDAQSGFETDVAVAVEQKDETDEAEHREKVDACQSFMDELDNIISEAEGCEFPGMYG